MISSNSYIEPIGLIVGCLVSILVLEACHQTCGVSMSKPRGEPLVLQGEYFDFLDSSDGGEELKSLVSVRLSQQKHKQLLLNAEDIPRNNSGLLAVSNTAGFEVLLIDDHCLRETYKAHLVDAHTTSPYSIFLIYDAEGLYRRFHVLIDSTTGEVLYVRPLL